MASNAQPASWPGLPKGVNSRTLPIRDLEMHILEAGDRSAPLLLLLHGFPELAYSWRKVIFPLAQLGYHTVAPDLRGYGQTKPRNPRDPGADHPVQYSDDLLPYRMLNLAHDVIALIFALGYTSVAGLVGHDFGSTLAGHCAIVRPDLFRAVVLMSSPYGGPPSLPFAIDPALDGASSSEPQPGPLALLNYVEAVLAQLNPPRKHYMHYYASQRANADMHGAQEGVRAFLRGYFHVKSADWDANDPHPIPASAEGLATLPHYYIMPHDASMADVARADAPSEEEVATKSSRWLPEDELSVFAHEFGRTGFQGGLNRYRAMIDEAFTQEMGLFAGRRIEVPAMFLAGRKDWGVYQFPGALEKLQKVVCKRMKDEDVVLVEGAGHWVQQERPDEVVMHIRRFLEKSQGN